MIVNEVIISDPRRRVKFQATKLFSSTRWSGGFFFLTFFPHISFLTFSFSHFLSHIFFFTFLTRWSGAVSFSHLQLVSLINWCRSVLAIWSSCAFTELIEFQSTEYNIQPNISHFHSWKIKCWIFRWLVLMQDWFSGSARGRKFLRPEGSPTLFGFSNHRWFKLFSSAATISISVRNVPGYISQWQPSKHLKGSFGAVCPFITFLSQST